MSLAGGLRELLRPPPHRGPLIAAGAVALTVGLGVSALRLRDTLAPGLLAAPLLASGALVFWLGAQAPNEDGRPPAYQSVLLATGLPLLYAGLLALVWPPAPGALVWSSAIVGGLALWPAFARNSAISVLLSMVLGGVALLAGWAWLFGWSPTAARWLLLLDALALLFASLPLREPARPHAEALIVAGGLAIAVIGLLTPRSLPWFWQLVLLAAGFGLVAFGALDRSPGPAYLGVANLALFILAAGASDDGLRWWPLVLLTAGLVMLAAGLRPRRPLPPEPDPYRAGEAPFAARADGGER
jgi:hypothetical protein